MDEDIPARPELAVHEGKERREVRPRLRSRRVRGEGPPPRADGKLQVGELGVGLGEKERKKETRKERKKEC